MSPAPDFEDDLFISYAHIDNTPLAEGLKGWVETLHERLRIRLEQLTGEPVKIWRDRKLQGNDVFADTLVARLSKAALLVAVVSPRYVKSEWCLRELGEFCRAASEGAGLSLGDKSRLFKVVKIHVPHGEHPPQLRGVLGYEFFEFDAERGHAKEFGTEVVPVRDIRYWEKLDDLAYDIKQLVETARRAETPTPPAAPAADVRTVYLAQTTSDLSNERDLVKRELQQHGHVVLPDRELPLRGDALAAVVRDSLSRSDLSVHLLGDFYGIIPEGEDRSLVEIQSELAAERGEALPRIVWMPPGSEPRDERQRRFVNHFRLGLNGHRGIEVLQTSLEDLKQFISERVARGRTPAAPEAESADGGGPASVYLICDREDIEAASPVSDYLFGEGLNVTLPATEGDEALLREDHKENLLDCDAALIYYGRANEVWVRMKQRELQKIAGYGRSRPMLAQGLYVAGPPTPVKERLRDRDSLVLKNYGAFAPESLRPFVERLRAAKGGAR